MSISFTAIDFETATSYHHSACAIGIVTVREGEIADEFFSLIQPPDNEYWARNIEIHGITPEDTFASPFFPEVLNEISKRIKGQTVVAHNESFDRSVLEKTMKYYGLNYGKLLLPSPWDCTLKIYRAKGYNPASLNACCDRLGINLDHHNALSDALACAKLYLLQ